MRKPIDPISPKAEAIYGQATSANGADADSFVAAVNDLAARTHKSKAEVLRDAVNLYYKAVSEWEENGRGIVSQPIGEIISPEMESSYQRRCLREGYWRSPIPWAGRAAARLLRKLTGDRRHA
jgi:hypothetical protein